MASSQWRVEMAQWVFKEIYSQHREYAAPGWIWELVRDDTAVQRSSRRFDNLRACKLDAACHGYYGGHYAVHVVRAERSQAAAVLVTA